MSRVARQLLERPRTGPSRVDEYAHAHEDDDAYEDEEEDDDTDGLVT